MNAHLQQGHDMDCGQVHIHVTGPWKFLTNGKVITTCCTEQCWCQPRPPHQEA